jgi:aminopeptidase N
MHERVHAGCGCGLAREASATAASRPFALSSSSKHYERDRPFEIKHLALDAAIDFESKSLAATVTLNVARIDKSARYLELDAIAFEIKAVSVDGHPVDVEYDGHTLRVPLGLRVNHASVRVRYKAYPRRGLYFLAPDAAYPKRPLQAWTQCQEEDARHFIPCHDKPHVKMTSALRIVVPEGFYALSNGDLLKEDEVAGKPRFAYEHREPHPSYLITLVVGQFARLESHAGSVALSYLVPRGKEKDAIASFGRTPQMIATFEKLLGVAYPWKSYAQVVVSDFIFGGMENTTATTLYEHVILDETARLDATSDDLIAHELAHQWFGDLVTCRDWSHGWLNEGFATYFEHVWREASEGIDAFHYGLLTDLSNYAVEARGRYRRAVVCAEYDAPLDLFDRHLYEKGGLFLHALRVRLGSEVFFAAVGDYLRVHAKSLVETRDLQRAFEARSGRSLERIFEEGLYKPGHPELDVDITIVGSELRVAVKQTQAAVDGVPAAFVVELWVEWAYGEIKDATKDLHRHRFMIDKRAETFTLPLARRPMFVVIDPNMQVLGEIVVHAPPEMFRAQLLHGPSGRARWLAAQALVSDADLLTERALATCLKRDREFWGVRAECAEALGRIGSSTAERTLLEHVETKHPKVRRAIVAALGRFKSSEVVAALKRAIESDASYFVTAESARSLGKTKHSSAKPVLEKLLKRTSWADVVAGSAVDGLVHLRDESSAQTLRALSQYGKPARVRHAAILGLPKLGEGRAVREDLESLLRDPDPHLRIDVARALLDLGDPRARGKLQEQLDADLDPRARRRLRETLRDLGGESKKAQSDLREEVEKLRTELLKLTQKVGALEAKPSVHSDKKSRVRRA